jgi:hypothetical protein
MFPHNDTIPDEVRDLLTTNAVQRIAVENLRKVVEATKEREAQGLVNHYLKPEKVMFTSDGKVKITDYGEPVFLTMMASSGPSGASPARPDTALPSASTKGETEYADAMKITEKSVGFILGKPPPERQCHRQPPPAAPVLGFTMVCRQRMRLPFAGFPARHR